MWRLALDHNFNRMLWAAVERQVAPQVLDVTQLAPVGLANAPDEEVLAWAADQGRILLTHDARTIPPLAYARVAAGLAMPGVIVVQQRAPQATAVASLSLVLLASVPDEWTGRVEWLPYTSPG